MAVELRADPTSLRVLSGERGVKPLTDRDRDEIRKNIDMPEAVHELLATEAAIEKLGARAISVDEAGQLPRNAHVIVRNRAGGSSRRVLIRRTDGDRALTIVVERTGDSARWLIVTG